MKRIVLGLSLVLLLSVSLLAADRGPSTPEERARFLKVTNQVIEDPLNDSNKPEMRWAFEWLTEVPDISVAICTGPIEALFKDKAKNDPGLVLIHTFAMARFVMEHPEQKSDDAAIQLAGMEAILKAYENAQKRDAKFKMKSMESYVKMQAAGTLADSVKKAARECRQ